MASDPYTMKKGMKPVARLGVVLRLQRTAESSATHRRPNLFNRLKIHGLSPYKIMSLVRLTCPFIWG
jgi:hypothetical protein